MVLNRPGGGSCGRVSRGMDGSSGYGLIELLSATAIAAVLSTLAVSSYRSQAIKAYRTEAKVALLSRAQELERCYTQFGAYDHIACPAITVSFGSPPRSPTARYELRELASANMFSLTAVTIGHQIDDRMCATLSISQTGARTSASRSGADTSAICW